MPIVVQHNVPAATLGGLAATAGDAQRMMQLYPLLVQQDQFAQQLGHQDAMAQFEAAQQAARQQQAMQFSAANQAWRDQQDFAQQSQLQRQGIIGQLLGQRNQAFLQDQLQEGRADDWMRRDQQAQRARAELDLQHQEEILKRRNAFEQEQLRREEAQKWVNTFHDPYSDYEKNTAQLQKQGLQYTPDQQEKLQKVRKEIATLQDRVSSGQSTLNDIMPDFQALHTQLNRIQPSQKVQTPQEQVLGNIVPLFGKKVGPDGTLVDDPENFLGYASPDPKSGTPKMVAPNRSGGRGANGELQEGTLDKTQIEQQKAYESYVQLREKQVSDMTKQIMDSSRDVEIPYAEARKQAEQLVPNSWDPAYTPKHLRGNTQNPPPAGQVSFGNPVEEMTSQTEVSFDPMTRASVALINKDPDAGNLAAEKEIYDRMQKIATSVPPEQQTPEFRAAYDRMQAVQAARSFSPTNPNPQGVDYLTKYIQRVSGGAKTKDQLSQLDPRVQKEILNLQLKLMSHLVSIGVLKRSE